MEIIIEPIFYKKRVVIKVKTEDWEKDVVINKEDIKVFNRVK